MLARVSTFAGSLLLLALAACAPGPTPYVPADPVAPAPLSFSEAPIEDRRFRVTFAANAATAPETVEDYLLFRAAEITLAEGADWFRIDAAGRKPELRYFAAAYGPQPVRITRLFGGTAVGEAAEPGPATAQSAGKRFRRKFGRGFRRGFRRRRSRFVFGFGFGGFFPFYGYRNRGYSPGYYAYRPRPVVTRLEASAEIRLFEGSKPTDDPAAYDARAVVEAIGPRILRPVPG
ncbi:MAG: hypothetical protein AAGE90_18660 [Pseudomonadota bacterium]